MLRSITLFGLGVTLLAGCASLEREARDAVIAELPSPHGTTFDELRRYPGQVICGRYTAADLQGFRSETRAFIYNGGEVYRRPARQQLHLFCTNEPAQALVRELGIGPWDKGEGMLGQIHRDLRTLTTAIAAHVAAEGDVPFSGLDALAPPLGDYLPALPKDPWGRPYHYEIGLGGRSTRDYKLFSLGQDGQPGGTGTAADVGRQHLPFLDRLARMDRS